MLSLQLVIEELTHVLIGWSSFQLLSRVVIYCCYSIS